MYENEIKEYEMLKTEISEKIQLDNNLTMFAVTTATGVMAFALSQEVALLYLAPFCILIPMSLRITYYRLAMAKIAAYLVVFMEGKIEGYNWETMNAKVMRKILETKDKDGYFGLLHIDFLILSVSYTIMTSAMFCFQMDFDGLMVAIILVMIACDFFEMYLTKKKNSVDAEKERWIRRWHDLENQNESCA